MSDFQLVDSTGSHACPHAKNSLPLGVSGPHGCSRAHASWIHIHTHALRSPSPRPQATPPTPPPPHATPTSRLPDWQRQPSLSTLGLLAIPIGKSRKNQSASGVIYADTTLHARTTQPDSRRLSRPRHNLLQCGHSWACRKKHRAATPDRPLALTGTGAGSMLSLDLALVPALDQQIDRLLLLGAR